MKKILCLTAVLALCGSLACAQTFTVDTLINNGNKANRINLVILAEGYTSSQQTQFISDATSMINEFFNTSPLNLYKPFFNVYAVRVVSQQSGAKHPGTSADCYTASPSVPVLNPTTYFGATFDYGGTHRLLYCTNTAAISQVLSTNTPWFDKALILVNTPYYGGSGGNYSIGSVHPSSAEIMIHEFGHSFAGLADEYGGGYCNGSEKPNVTQQTDPNLIKWKNWINPGTPIPTPVNTNCGGAGLHNGANYCTNGWYRPQCECKMRTLGQQLCSVCKQEFVVKIHQYVNLIDIYSPTSLALTLNTGSQTFSASVLQPTANTVKRVWKLNGNTVATNVNSYTVNATNLLVGTNTLVLSTIDTTLLCRVTLPTHAVTWTITKSSTGTVATLAAFNPVCQNAPAFTLTGGLPLGGVYSGNGVSNGVFNPSVAGPGTHQITYTVSGSSASQNIVVNAVPIIGGTNSASVCIGATVTLSASGASAYSWSPSTALSATTGASVVASPTVNTTYTVTATASNGCTSTKAVPVSIKTLPVISTSANTSVCTGGSTVLSASGASTYIWSPVATLSASTGSSVTATPAATTTYTVIGTGTNGCSASKTIVISVGAATGIVVNGNTSICNGSSASLTASGATNYTWAPSTGLNVTTGASVTASPAVNTTYTVSGTSGSCTVSQTVAINVNALGSVNISGNTFVCTGSSTTLTASGATTYAWSPGTGLNVTTGASVIATPAVSTTYTVTASSGTCSTTKTVAVSVGTAPTVTGSNNTTICSGSSTNLTAAGASTYTWAPATGLNVTTGTNVTASPSSSTTYTVTGFSAGCSNTKTIVVSVAPNYTLSVNSPTASVCNGTPATLTASGATTYTWAPGTGLNTTTGSSVSALPSVTTTYTVTGNKNGCIKTNTLVVSIGNASVSTTASATGICSGSSTSITASGGVSYSWAPNTGLNTTTGSSVIASPAVTTTYTITGTASNGCTGSTTRVISVTANFTLSSTANQVTCQGNGVSLSASGANTYTWSPGTGLSATTGATVTATPTVTTTYTVTGTKSFCVKTKTIVVTVNPKPVLSVTTLPAACGTLATGSIDLSVTGVSGALMYNWSNGATTQDLAAVVAGSYAVTVTANNGCTSSTTVSVAGGACLVPSQYLVQNVTNSGATLRWNKVACGVKYMIRYRPSASNTWTYVLLNDTMITLTNLPQSTSYQFQVQTYCNPQLTDSSGYGATQTFGTSGGCTTPAGMSTTGLTFQSATMNWGAVSGAWGYRVRIRKSNNSNAWQEYVVQAPATSYTVSGLSSATGYKWQVMTLCNAAGTSISAYGALVYFTTFAGREDEGETPALPEANGGAVTVVLNAYPNPATGPVTVTVEQAHEADAVLELYSLHGQMLRRRDIVLSPGVNTFPFDIHDLPAGGYVLYLRQQSGTGTHKLIKQ